MAEDRTSKGAGHQHPDARLDLLQAARASLGPELHRIGLPPAQAARQHAESPPLLDGRALRRKGRTEQLNIRITPELKAALIGKAADCGMTIADLVILALESSLGSGDIKR
ncbi:hypothetical protein [Aurantimonas sp. 22II-16-19i]|uniref:hypothetical protein n=1 Tax=Aurantimonas sp. 22II-16-19i TaxID=1317114 RepID=UPI0009F7C2A1|nr:hypothetical protein [Aurantimonas sp. 22II-16-19i]ORE93255.1 hypothetical protein ATO4_15930 [Aurantimonas sp. 22II-16-19i]